MYNTTRLRRRFFHAAPVVAVLLFGFWCTRHGRGAPPATPEVDSQRVAETLLARAGIQRGVCALLGAEGDMALALAESSELLVHVREPLPEKVADLRERADAAGFGIDRVAVEQGRLDRLPYADNMVDVVLATQASADVLAAVSPDEVLRVLRPEGTAIVGSSNRSKGGAGKLKQWAQTGGAERIETWEDANGAWVQFFKPAMKGADEWTHWEHGPDNNPVSTDSVIQAPYMTQFLADPMYIPMPSITTAAGGRTFLAIGHIAHHRREWGMLNKLIARNGYNGTILWQRDLPEGYLVHRSAFVASKETFYMIDGNRCLLLDPETGTEKDEIRIPGIAGAWKWMVIDDGVLYVLAGKKGPGTQTTKGDRSFGGWSWSDLSPGYYRKLRVPWGFGETLAAYDLQRERLLWKHQEDEPIDSRAMALGDGRVFLYCPDRHLRCLDASTGEVIWTNHETQLLELIEEPGKKLTSTPGFRSACLTVYTPDALIMQGQTRMNVVAVSTAEGYLLWTKRKVTNNPNAIYVDGNVVLGVGKGGSHLVLDPRTGTELEDLNFRKTSCTRLTASPDSFFCRGEGTLRFDRAGKRVLVDGAIRPACNDGALPANGMLYLGPWQCDCNLSLIGSIAKCSAGDFRFDIRATEEDRLERATKNFEAVEPFDVSPLDWPTYRANVQRTAGTKADVVRRVTQKWQHTPRWSHVPTAPVSAGDLVFVTGRDGKVRALESSTGATRWEFSTPGSIRMPPTVYEGRMYFGSADGYAYALEAATGRLLWRFRASPVERHIMVYGSLSSTWPVNSGVLVRDGVAYFAAGIIDYDGTYVYAVDAKTGKIQWQNNSCGHVNGELRKGVSVQGNLTIQGDQLLLAGGNQISPARFDLQTGKLLAESFDQGRPKANHGQFVGVYRDRHAIAGGRILFSSAKNVSTKGSFVAFVDEKPRTLNFGGIPPAWDEKTVAMVNYQNGKLTCYDSNQVADRLQKGFPSSEDKPRRRRAALAEVFDAEGAVRWQSDLGESNKFEALSLAVCPNAIVAVMQYQQKYRSQPQWFVVAFDAEDGIIYWRHEIDSEPLPGGLLVDRGGQILVTMLKGDVLCLGAGE